jgi:predicted lipoprotein with Yx(FWY)xxD motif
VVRLQVKSWLGILILIISNLIACAVAQDQTVQISYDKSLGNYLVDGSGRTLYYSINDAPGNSNSNCYGDCVNNWPLFYSDMIIVASGLTTSDFATISRGDGRHQTSYKGWPLYYSSKDKRPGDINGQGTNNVWFVINPYSFSPM